jgi:hypothetical protein
MSDRQDEIEVLACDWQARPKDAPAIGKLAQLARGAERRDGELLVMFDASATQDVERFAAAERQCCATIQWEARTAGDWIELSVRGSPEQLAVLDRLFSARRREP